MADTFVKCCVRKLPYRRIRSKLQSGSRILDAGLVLACFKKVRLQMSKFLNYLRNDKGGAVEYVLVVGVIGGLVVTAANSAAVKTAINNMFTGVFNAASSKSTF